MPTPGWGAAIQGDPADLSVWQHMLKHQSDVWVETHDSETVLRATSLDESESGTEARDRAIAYIDRLNGAISVSHDSRPVQLRAVIRFKGDGHLERTLFAESAKYEARGGMIGAGTVVGSDGQPVPSTAPAPSEVQRWSGIADQETWLDDALIYFGKATNWFDIYKALECLMDKYGGETAFVKLNWAPPDEVRRLKRTANSFRHANRNKHRPPQNPMGLKEGRELLGQLLRRALDEEAATSVWRFSQGLVRSIAHSVTAATSATMSGKGHVFSYVDAALVGCGHVSLLMRRGWPLALMLCAVGYWASADGNNNISLQMTPGLFHYPAYLGARVISNPNSSFKAVGSRR
jgi:hypothetical protein